jgi:hypothetical protein
MHKKRSILISSIVIAVISFLLGVFVTNHYHATNTMRSSADQTFNNKPEPSSKYSSVFAGEHKSPWDENKKVIVQGDEFNGYNITIQNQDKSIEIMSAIGPQAFTWNYNSDKVAFVDHEVSNHDSTHIIDFIRNSHVQAEGEEQFVQSQKNPSDYSHIYTHIFGWYDDDSLIVSVSGHPDSRDFQSKSQLFLVDANSGKVIKRVL